MQKYSFIFLALSLCAGALAAEDYRLPLTIMPVHYDLTLQPYLQESDAGRLFSFDGEAVIEVVVQESTKFLIMHTKNLIYSERYYTSATSPNTPIQLNQFSLNTVTDKINYTLPTIWQAGEKYYLHFKYIGSMDDDMHGFYRSSYVDSNGKTKWIGSTQFQTNHARRAFPSFDEPKFKATFQVKMIRPNFMSSYGNTRFTTTDKDSNYKIDTYQTTPKMSTYLLAFLVSEFSDRHNDNFGVLSRPEYYDQTEYSFTTGQQLLAALEKYMGIDYYTMGVDKMHLAAIPDFSAGAMENWGLLTFRERGLLLAEGSTTLSDKQYIAKVVAHEQTHMYFGDLVTCDWWSYTWLNEGFARYFQYFGTALVETEWELEKQFVVDQIHAVMGVDALASTNPMSDENTNTPDDLSRMFNTISYNKGGTFVRSVTHIMGEKKFQTAIQEYLKERQYTNTIPQNLFDHFLKYWPAEHMSHADAYFKSFTEQVGFPLITINMDKDGKGFTIQQKRFLLKSNDGADATIRYTVPISYTTSAEQNFTDTAPKLFIAPEAETTRVTLNQQVYWVLANIQEAFYYRVNYDEQTWHTIRNVLHSSNWGGVHELNRAQMVDDLLNLARTGEISYDLCLTILEYLSTETKYSPWAAAFTGFNYLRVRLGSNTQQFEHYITELTEKAYKSLDFAAKATDSAMDILLRSLVINWSCKNGNQDCIDKALTYFRGMKETAVPVDIRSPVYCTAMREGTEADFDQLYETYQKETIATEIALIINSLGCVKNQTLIEKYFEIILSDSIRRQDKSNALSYLYTSNNENVSPVFKLVTDNYHRLATAMGSYASVATVISNIASRFTEMQQLQELMSFNLQNKEQFGSSAGTLERAELAVTDNLAWASERMPSFNAYLEKRTSGSALHSGFSALTLLVAALIARYLY